MCQKPPVRDQWHVFDTKKWNISCAQNLRFCCTQNSTNQMVVFEHAEYHSSQVSGILLSKRGQLVDLAKSKLAGFILIIFIAIVLLSFIGKISMTSDDVSVEEQCRASVLRNARYHLAGIELGSEIDCPTRNLELKEGYSDKEAKEKLARAMYGCWRQFGQGKLNLFNENKVFCNVCYIVDVKSAPIIGFETYLKETPSPTENEYYYDYLRSKKSEGAEDAGFLNTIDKMFNAPLRKVDEIELKQLSDSDKTVISNTAPDNKYAIIFVYAKGHDNVEKLGRQVLLKSAGGKVITPVALGVAVAAGATVALASAPFVVVVGTGLALAGAVEYVGQIFNPDMPPEWAAFTVLRQWNSYDAASILKEEIGCQEFVETQSN